MLQTLKIWAHPFRQIEHIVREELKHHYIDQVADRLLQKTLTESARGVTDFSYDLGKQVIVTLTSHHKRIYDVCLTIESIMQGTYKPNRIILWLGEEYRDSRLPKTLLQQQTRGLEIHYVEDVGPHTKLVPALVRYPDDILVTIDDDIFYAYDFLENLIKAYQQNPVSIHACRVTEMTFTPDGQLNHYFQWKQMQHPKEDTFRNMITGVEGCLYPPHSLHEEATHVASFRNLCPTADDVWFTAMAILKGTLVRHLYTHYDRGCAGSLNSRRHQDIALLKKNENPADCLNEKQIKAVFEYYGIYERLAQSGCCH